MFTMLLPILIAQAAAAQAGGRAQPDPRAPAEIVAAAPASEWISIAADDLLVLDLSSGPARRRVIIQLMPRPFAQPWIGNIRALAAAHWWDGTSVNRVQDNYVVQWGDASEKKPLPPRLAIAPESAYTVDQAALPAGETVPGPGDVYAAGTRFYRGWPLGIDAASSPARRAWPVHCYGMVGVGRDVSPSTGTGAELYVVIGHAPRHLDRNIALVGRVIDGVEHLSSLPRGSLALGFYERPEQRVPITSLRLASEIPAAERPHFQYLSTNGATWSRYVTARANRKDAFFMRPAGAVDICNLPVPIRRTP